MVVSDYKTTTSESETTVSESETVVSESKTAVSDVRNGRFGRSNVRTRSRWFAGGLLGLVRSFPLPVLNPTTETRTDTNFAIFRKILSFFWTCSKVFERFRMCSDLFGRIRTRSDLFGNFRRFFSVRKIFRTRFSQDLEELRQNGRQNRIPRNFLL